MQFKPITFVTHIPNLSVVFDEGDIIQDRNGKAVGNNPPRFAEFANGVYVAKESVIALKLLGKLSRAILYGDNCTFTVSSVSHDDANALANENGIELQVRRLSNGNAPIKAFGESEKDKSGKEFGDGRNSNDVVHAEDVDPLKPIESPTEVVGDGKQSAQEPAKAKKPAKKPAKAKK